MCTTNLTARLGEARRTTTPVIGNAAALVDSETHARAVANVSRSNLPATTTTTEAAGPARVTLRKNSADEDARRLAARGAGSGRAVLANLGTSGLGG